jgi:hypothetical protein
VAVAPIIEFGFLTVTASPAELSVVFKVSGGEGAVVRDSVVIDLQKNRISSQGAQMSKSATSTTKPKPQNPRARPTAKKKKNTRR